MPHSHTANKCCITRPPSILNAAGSSGRCTVLMSAHVVRDGGAVASGKRRRRMCCSEIRSHRHRSRPKSGDRCLLSRHPMIFDVKQQSEDFLGARARRCFRRIWCRS
jgi:hypothetical protein